MTPLSDQADTPKYLRAIRLINIENDLCDFETGCMPIRQHVNATHFFAQTDTALQSSLHPAPRRQYVITLKGKLKFKVSSGATFLLEPGIILIANDTAGLGHSWEIIDGNEWERIYIPLNDNDDDHFISDNER